MSSLSAGQIRLLQTNLNERLRARGRAGVSVDGEYGPETAAAVHLVKYLLGFPTHSLDTGPSDFFRTIVGHPDQRPKSYLAVAKDRIAYLAREAAAQPLRLKAYEAAASQVGVMETGGNNRGVPLTRYIRTNQGVGPEPWCGDFQAWCYRQAGSKAVTRSWAAVRLFGGIVGVKRVDQPLRGDLVRFDFSSSGLDHIGMFSRDLGDGRIETIEGNTGASGAVSDSSTGGDGVYRKVRSKALVHDYLRITK